MFRELAMKKTPFTLFAVVSLLFCCASAGTESEINATATESGNGTLARPKEDSFADIIDRALEKEFNETDQNEGPY